jgi:hypothetical protein
MKYRVHTEYSISTNGQSMAIIQETLGGHRAFLQPLQFKAFAPNIMVPREEAFAITDDFGDENVKPFLQAMMNAAWDLGLRPTQAKDQTGELAALRLHLEDMRTLALKVRP